MTNHHDRFDMSLLTLALLVALVAFFHWFMGPTGDGPRAVATYTPPGSIMTATPPFRVYVAAVEVSQ